MRRQATNPIWALREGLREASLARPDVIDLSRGDPDLPTPPNVIAAAVAALQAGKTHYTSPAGIPTLRRAIAEKLQRDNGIPVGPEGIMITAGVMEAVSIVLRALLDPGDEVILADPNYPGYETAILMAGGRAVFVPAGPDEGFNISLETVAHAVTPKTKVILLVTPSNPCGAVASEADLESLAALAQERDILVISDEIYERYVWMGARHHSIASFPGMADRTITVNGFSKTYCMAGWRLGYIAGPRDFIARLSEVRYAYSICAAEFVQWAALEALRPETQSYVEAVVTEFNERRQAFVQALDRMGLPHSQPRGGYFVLFAPRDAGSGAEVALDLVLRAGVYTWPGVMFGSTIKSFVRVGLVRPVPILEEAAARLEWWLRQGG